MPEIERDDEDSCGIRLAISLEDLVTVDTAIRSRLLSPRLELSKVVFPDPLRPKHRAVAFRCNLLEAALACDVLRSKNGKVKLWMLKRVWSRLPDSKALTVILDDGVAALDPSVFGIPLPAEDPIIPEAEPFGWGGDNA